MTSTGSLTGAFNVALSGLQVSSAAAQLISGNVANSQTPGYTEKQINLSTPYGISSFGSVTISSYSRTTNDVLSATLNSATSSASYLSTQNSYMSQVQSLLDSTNDPPALSSALSNFQAAWTQYSATPSDVTAEKTVVLTGEALASTINSIATQTATLKNNAENNLATSVTSFNTDLATIASLNGQIATASGENQPTIDLQDQRDQVINQLSQYTNVLVLPRQNGEVAVYTPGGTALVDGGASTFSVGSSTTILNATGANVTSQLTGGSLQAQTDFLSSSTSTANGVGVIAKLQSQIQNFANMFVATTTGVPANSFADTYNAATSTGSSELASGFFTTNVDPTTGLPDITSFAVNSALVNGTQTVKINSAASIANTFNASNLAISTSAPPAPYTYTTTGTFSANGLTTLNQNYGNITTAILSGFQQAANTIQTQNQAASTQQSYYQSSLSSATGVNTDAELVNLTNWENSYAASAHVISTIQQMMTVLEGLIQ